MCQKTLQQSMRRQPVLYLGGSGMLWLFLSACAPLSETHLGPGFGESVRANQAAQVLVPDRAPATYPENQTVSGEQAQRALERMYRSDGAAERSRILTGLGN